MRGTPMVGRASPQGLTTMKHHWGTGLRAQMRQDMLAHTDTLVHHTDTLAHPTDTLAHKGLDSDVTNTS